MSGSIWRLFRAEFTGANIVRALWMSFAIFSVIVLFADDVLAQAAATPQAAPGQAVAEKSLEDRVRELEAVIATMKSGAASSERNPAATISGPQSPVKNADSLCPPGSYVFGIESWGAAPSTRYCIGCMTGLRVLCRRLVP